MLRCVQRVSKILLQSEAAELAIVTWDHQRQLNRTTDVSTPTKTRRLGLGSPMVQVAVDATSRRLQVVLVRTMCRCHRQQLHALWIHLLPRGEDFHASQATVSDTPGHPPRLVLRCLKTGPPSIQAEPLRWPTRPSHLLSRQISRPHPECKALPHRRHHLVLVLRAEGLPPAHRRDQLHLHLDPPLAQRVEIESSAQASMPSLAACQVPLGRGRV